MLFVFQLISVLTLWNVFINMKKMLRRPLLTAHWHESVFNKTNEGLYGNSHLAINVNYYLSLAIYAYKYLDRTMCCTRTDYIQRCIG